MWIERTISKNIESAITKRVVILLTGARQTGKTSLLKKIAPSAEYATVDNMILVSEAEENPGAFLSRFKEQAIIDEIQYSPNTFSDI